mgnify:CR=1 FL=1
MSLSVRDWRRRVAAAYADVRARAGPAPEAPLARFRATKGRIFVPVRAGERLPPSDGGRRTSAFTGDGLRA